MQIFEVVVVGAGQAGIEAALASARMGRQTACITLRLDRVGHLPCNCSIGGPAKGHIAREVDAIGGQMAVTTDYTLTHLRRVGTSKGPAVQTTRAQVCKNDYPIFMRQVLEKQPNLTLIEGMVDSIEINSGGEITGVRVSSIQSEGGQRESELIGCSAVVITTGTFLNGLCHEGRSKTVAARHGDKSVSSLAEFLVDLGVRTRRFKTGTTPRVSLASLNLDKTEVMPSELEAGPLSFLHDRIFPKFDLLPTWQTRTTPKTHDLLSQNLSESAMYAGEIEGIGPRYCPSIEDKVVRFAGKDSHPIFFEVEEWNNDSVYVQGFSSSMPGEIQLAALKTIPGMEDVAMIRPGYAVEYDMADPLQLRPSLMSKLLDGLFLAGQINGTSGYEEAAGQGIVAGINAALYVRGEEELTFPRTESFIGVMIDDLVTKGVEDPYRMLTSRAEHRLVLRHDNADQRLTPTAERLGIACEERLARFEKKLAIMDSAKDWLSSNYFYEANNGLLDTLEIVSSANHVPVRGKLSFMDLLKRPEMNLELIEVLATKTGLDCSAAIPSQAQSPDYGALEPVSRAQIEIESIYSGYLKRQDDEVEVARKLDEMQIPASLRFIGLTGISHESQEKLDRVRPTTIGQASRIPGVRPSDIALLIGHLRGVVKLPNKTTKI